jgi:hypothetical protein
VQDINCNLDEKAFIKFSCLLHENLMSNSISLG